MTPAIMFQFMLNTRLYAEYTPYIALDCEFYPQNAKFDGHVREITIINYYGYALFQDKKILLDDLPEVKKKIKKILSQSDKTIILILYIYFLERILIGDFLHDPCISDPAGDLACFGSWVS